MFDSPDHLHLLWTLPHRDDASWLRWRWIEREFTRRWFALVTTTLIGGAGLTAEPLPGNAGQ